MSHVVRITDKTYRQLEYLMRRNYGGYDLNDASLFLYCHVLDLYNGERKKEARQRKLVAAREQRAAREALAQAAGSPISARLVNVLLAHGVEDFSDLAARFTESEIMKWRDMGKKTMRELKRILADKNLRFRISRANRVHA